MRTLTLFGLLALGGCTSVYEGGKCVMRSSSDLTNVRIKTAGGTVAEFGAVKNSQIHRDAWAGATKGITAAGAAIITQGAVK